MVLVLVLLLPVLMAVCVRMCEFGPHAVASCSAFNTAVPSNITGLK
jgi:hypothetical protein